MDRWVGLCKKGCAVLRPDKAILCCNPISTRLRDQFRPHLRQTSEPLYHICPSQRKLPVAQVSVQPSIFVASIPDRLSTVPDHGWGLWPNAEKSYEGELKLQHTMILSGAHMGDTAVATRPDLRVYVFPASTHSCPIAWDNDNVPAVLWTRWRVMRAPSADPSACPSPSVAKQQGIHAGRAAFHKALSSALSCHIQARVVSTLGGQSCRGGRHASALDAGVAAANVWTMRHEARSRQCKTRPAQSDGSPYNPSMHVPPQSDLNPLHRRCAKLGPHNNPPADPARGRPRRNRRPSRRRGCPRK